MSLRSRASAIGAGALALAMLALLWAAWTMGPDLPKTSDGEVPIVASDEAAIVGRVLDPEGEGVAGASVRATPAGGGDTVNVTSGAAGHFAFGALAEGAWNLDASAETLINPGPSDKRVMTVHVDDTSTLELDLQLHRAAVVSGRVVADGSGVAGATLFADVFYCDSLGGQLGRFRVEIGSSDADGSFRAELPPGRLRIVASRSGGPAAARAESEELVLTDGVARDGVVIDLANRGRGGRVEGVISGSDGRPIAAIVELYGQGRPREIRSDGAGHYKLVDLAAGHYRMRVRAVGHGTVEAEIDVRDGETTVKDVALSGGGALRGRVVDSADQPVAGATVVVRKGNETATVLSGHDGSFAIEQPEQLGAGATVQAVSLQHSDTQIENAIAGSEVVLKLGPGGVVKGQVQDAEGHPIAGAVVSVLGWQALDPDPFSPHQVEPVRIGGADGTFTLGPLRPGSYRLRGEAPWRGATTVEGIAVHAGGETTGVVLRLTGGGVVRGIVRDEEGAAVEGANIQLTEASAVLPPKMTKSDGDGRYEIKGVTAGRHSLRAMQQGYLTVMESGIEVADGGDVSRDVVLRTRKEGERFAFQGIGATLGLDGGAVVVRNLLADAPARAAGLRDGDRIRSVDGVATRGMALSAVVERIRGEPGSPVMLDIERPGQGPLVLSIVRGQVVVK